LAALAGAALLAACGAAPEESGAEDTAAPSQAAEAQTPAAQASAAPAQQRAWTPPTGPLAPLRTDIFGFTIGMLEAAANQRVAADGWSPVGQVNYFSQTYHSAARNHVSRDARSVTYASSNGQDALRLFMWDRGDGVSEVYAIIWYPYHGVSTNDFIRQGEELRNAWMARFFEMYGVTPTLKFVYSPAGLRVDAGPDAEGQLATQCVQRVVVSISCGLAITEWRLDTVAPYVIFTNGQAVAWLRDEPSPDAAYCQPSPTESCTN